MKTNSNKKSVFLKPLVLAMTLPGSAFAAQVDCTIASNWVASQVYTAPGQVIQSNKLFEAKWWTTNENPNSTGQWGVWKTLGDCGGPVNELPKVSFTSPSENSEFKLDDSVDLTVSATDTDGTIETTVFTIDDKVVSSPWTADSTGNKQVKVLVTDNDGGTAEALVNITIKDGIVDMPQVSIDSPTSPVSINEGKNLEVVVSASVAEPDNSITKVQLKIDNAVSSELQVTVLGNPAPVTSITAPAAQSNYKEGESVTITADASDDSKIDNVEFFVGSTSIGVVSTAPYSVNWTAIGNGAQRLTVVATDDKTAQTTSSTVIINVGSDVINHEACRPDGLVGDPLYCDVYDTDGREVMANARWGLVRMMLTPYLPTITFILVVFMAPKYSPVFCLIV